ncbi:MAG TPA: phosphoserine aminotransferase, partial [Thalassospira sp.]|nr:phosphoserine aminotransferase [Thalassospira sp.]
MAQTAEIAKPTLRPTSPNFSSGPCKKRPGWSAEALQTEVLGRSHRSKFGKQRLEEVIDRSRAILNL